jgi:hypothetical protein
MSPAAHDDRTVHCHFAEMLKIRFQTPRQLPVPPYDRIVANRSNEHDLHNAASSFQENFETNALRRKSPGTSTEKL